MGDRWLVLALAFVARLTLPVQFQTIAPIMPSLVGDLGISYAQTGLLIGVFWLPGLVLALPGGMIGGRYGDKNVIVGGLACMTAGAMVLGATTSFSVVLAGRLLSGIGAVVLNVQLTKIVTDRFAGREIATALAILLTSWPFGIAIAMATLGFVATAASWHVAVYLTAGFTAAALASMAMFYRDDAVPLHSMPKLWNIARRELGLVIVASLVWMLFNVSFTVVTSFAPLLLISRGHGAAEASALVSLLSWVSLIAVPLGGYMADRMARPNWIIAGGAIVSGAAIALLVLPGPAVLWIVLFGVAGSLGPGSMMALPSEVLRPQARSTGLGVFYTTYYAGMVMFPPIAGAVYDHTGTAASAVLVGALSRILTAAALAGFRIAQERWPASATVTPTA